MTGNTLNDRGALTVDEFCRFAGIGRSKLYKEAGAGRIRLRKVGRKTVILVSDAQAWLASLPEAEISNAA